MRTTTLILAAVLAWSAGLLRTEDQAPPSDPKARQEQVNKLIALLKSDAGLYEKHGACRELAVIGTKEAVPVLVGLLGDEKLGHMARTGLETIPDPAVDEALREALGKLKGGPLLGVINSIGVRRDAKAIEPLAKLLDDPDEAVVCAAAASLGRIGTSDASKALLQKMQKPDGPKQVNVDSALCEGLMCCADASLVQGDRDAAAALYDFVRHPQYPRHVRMAAMRGAIVSRGAGGIPLLIAQLKGDDAAMFAAALRAAHEIPGAELTQALAAECAKLSPDKQIPVLQTLGNRGDATAVPAVLTAAKSGADNVRLTAIHVLTQLGEPSALPLLVELAASADTDVARAAQSGLASFPEKAADEAIASLWNQADAKARRLAVDLAGQRRVANAVPALLKAAEDSDEAVRIASLKVLGDLAGAAELPALLSLLAKAKTPPETQAAEAALASLCARQNNAEACADKVVASLVLAGGGSRLALLRVLRSVGGAKALAAVRAAATDADPIYKDTALHILCEWPGAEALPDLAQLAKTSADPKLKILALRGFIRLQAKQDAPAEKKLAALKEALALAERGEEKKLVLAALGEVPLPESAMVVEACMADEAVKAEAELALLKLAQGMGAANPDEAKAALSKLSASTANANLKKQALGLLQQLGKSGDFVGAWQAAGPYTQAGKDGYGLFDVPLPPEPQAGTAAPRSTAVPAVPTGETPVLPVKWVMMALGTERGGATMMDLAAACGAGNSMVAYVRTWVRSDKEQPARFVFGTDDGNKLWLNGKLVHSNPTGGAATPDKYNVNVTLKQGWNALLMKVAQVSGAWEFCFRICKPDGGKHEGLKVQATAPAE